MNDLLGRLLALTIASSLGIAVALLARRGVRRAFGAVAGYSTWLLVPAAMIAGLLPAAQQPAFAPRVSFQIETIPVISHAIELSVHAVDSWVGAAAPAHGSLWLIGAWLTGAAVALLYLVGLQRAFVGSLGRLSGSRGVLRAQSSVGCPALLGALRPKVVLPVDFSTRYTRRERRLVLAHERVHLHRCDALWNALVAVLRCLFWFNPLVHLASGCMRIDQELACDATVMERYSGSRRTYAEAMLKTQVVDAVLPAGCHWQSARQLKKRLAVLKRSSPGLLRRACGRAFVSVAALAVGYAAWAAEPEVLAGVTATADPAAAAEGTPSFTLELGEAGALTLSIPASAGGLQYDAEKLWQTRLPPKVTMEGLRVSFANAPSQVTITRAADAGPPEAVNATLTVTAEEAVMTPRAPGGGPETGLVVTFEKGCTATLTMSSGRGRTYASPVCRFRGPVMLFASHDGSGVQNNSR